MKLKITLLCIFVGFIAVYGWHFYYDSFNNYSTSKELQTEISAVSKDNDDIVEAINSFCLNDMVAYAAPTSDTLYDFTSDFLDKTSSTFNKAIGKRFINNAATTVASCSSVDELHNISGVDAIEIIVTVDDLTLFLQSLERAQYAINKITVYPTDNCVSVEFFVLGGVE